MDKATLDKFWDQMRQKYGVYLRLLEAMPESCYHTHPIAGMRTPAELVAHVCGTAIRDMAQGVAKGEITADEAAEAGVAAGLRTRADMLTLARECWRQADAAVATVGDAQLSAMVSTPWGITFPGWVGFDMMNDEFVHHRGQLYAFARACGAEPPFMWGFADNAPEFRPGRAASPAGAAGP
jgi:uncharacterized damage-inducible protein DinB